MKKLLSRTFIQQNARKLADFQLCVATNQSMVGRNQEKNAF
jgi:hypothetical protein